MAKSAESEGGFRGVFGLSILFCFSSLFSRMSVSATSFIGPAAFAQVEQHAFTRALLALEPKCMGSHRPWQEQMQAMETYCSSSAY